MKYPGFVAWLRCSNIYSHELILERPFGHRWVNISTGGVVTKLQKIVQVKLQAKAVEEL